MAVGGVASSEHDAASLGGVGVDLTLLVGAGSEASGELGLSVTGIVDAVASIRVIGTAGDDSVGGQGGVEGGSGSLILALEDRSREALGVSLHHAGGAGGSGSAVGAVDSALVGGQAGVLLLDDLAGSGEGGSDDGSEGQGEQNEVHFK